LGKQLRSLNRRQYQIHLARNAYASGFQEPLLRVREILEDASVKTEVAYLIGHHNVYSLRQADVARKAFDEDNAVAKSIGPREFTRDRTDSALFDGIDPTRTGAASEQPENTRPGR
jgi:hypothetical protein